MPLRVCFVCLGNICRSPIAEVVFRRLVDEAGLAGAVEVASAGTGDWHVGEPADPRTLETLRRRGYDGAAHRARRFVAGWFEDFDLVVALDSANARDLRALAPGPDAAAKVRLLRSYGGEEVGEMDVPDPYFGGPEGFDDVFDVVEAACRALLEEVRRELAP